MRLHIPTATAMPLIDPSACRKCGGSGQFKAYTGRIVGDCFACNGTGKAPARLVVPPAANLAGTGFERLLACFNKAAATGLRRPTLRAKRFTFSLASESSRNPGYIYIKISGEYRGKISPSGAFSPRDCSSENLAAINEVARDPLAAAVEHGRLTGNCAICGRALTDPESVARGIGPVCAERFGFL